MSYDVQHRGDAAAYDLYLRGMDASMRQKVALTAAHLLCEGAVADMGCGSGAQSHALASLYPELRVTGVDVNPEMVVRAREKYALPNLRFVVGDIASPCFEPGSQEAIVDSSVLHHVTSFNGYDRAAAARALEVQAAQLADHGVLIVRDFVDPGPGTVLLDLAEKADLFERFAREFRRLSAAPGFEYRELPAPAGFRRFECAHTHAVEFVLRKDYEESWDAEVLEEYTYMTQVEFEAAFARLGLRVLASTPIHNPWIVRRRFEGRFVIRDAGGGDLGFPATNYLIVGQKVPAGEGVRLEAGPAAEPRGFLDVTHWRRDDGAVHDLVRRPHPVVDVIPWFRRDDAVFVLARRSYPRPIVGRTITEPLNMPAGGSVEALLDEHGLRVRAVEEGTRYFPSPGGLQEEVRSVFAEIEPANVRVRMRNVSGFSTSGHLRAMEARQVLRAAQVGALPEARLELNVYDLLRRLRVDPGEWIGEPIERGPAEAPSRVECPPRRRFAPASDGAGFIDRRCREFIEFAADGRELGRRALEFVVPATRSLRTIAEAFIEGDCIGLEEIDQPALQCFEGRSDALVVPARRLDEGEPLPAVGALGGPYHPSPGVTPEIVHPYVRGRTDEPLTWVHLADLAHALDGHTRIVALRAAHALGLLH